MGLTPLLSAGNSLSTHDATTPVSLGILILLGVTFLDGLDQLGQLRLVLGSDLGEGEDSSSLLVNDRAEPGLTLDDGIRDTHLSAKSWEEDNQLNWVNIVGDEDQRSLLVLDQADNVVEAILDCVRLLANVFLLLALLDSSSLLDQSLLLLGLALRSVFVQQLEGLGGGVSVEDILELRDRRWDLQAEVEDLALTLKTDILGPLNHPRKVSSRLDICTDAIVPGALLDERVLGGLLGSGTSLGLGEWGGSSFFSGFWRLSLRKKTSANMFTNEHLEL